MIRAFCDRGAVRGKLRVVAWTSSSSSSSRRSNARGLVRDGPTAAQHAAKKAYSSSSSSYFYGHNHSHGDMKVAISAAVSVALLGTALTLCEVVPEVQTSPPVHLVGAPSEEADVTFVSSKVDIREAREAIQRHLEHGSPGTEGKVFDRIKADSSQSGTESGTETKTKPEPNKQRNPHHLVRKLAKGEQKFSQLQATSPDEDIMDSLMGEWSFNQEMTESEARLEESARKARQHSGGIKIFSGNGNMALAMEVTRHLGIELGKATVGRFADGEVNVVIKENVRGKDVYVVQPTCPPVNDNLMELLLIVSTLRRASARRITVVIPYYGYARQDRKMQARVPISAADVARLMEAIGVDRVIAVDLHCGQIQGFFGPRVPVDNLDGGIVGLDYFGSKDLHRPVIVSPDAGGVYRAKKFKEGLEQKFDFTDLGLAMIVKQRARAGSVDQMDLVGDVKDCDCIIVDDMIDTAGTLCKAAEVLKAKGAARVFAFASHGLLSGPGNERIAASQMEEVVILNTIPTSPQREANEKLTVLSVADLLARAIFNIHAKKSVSALFK